MLYLTPSSLPFHVLKYLPFVVDLFYFSLLIQIDVFIFVFVELRYHLELLEVAYKGSTDYIEVVNRIQSLQRLLGNLQDLQVLALLLQKRHGSLKKMPALAVAIYKQYWEVNDLTFACS